MEKTMRHFILPLLFSGIFSAASVHAEVIDMCGKNCNRDSDRPFSIVDVYSPLGANLEILCGVAKETAFEEAEEACANLGSHFAVDDFEGSGTSSGPIDGYPSGMKHCVFEGGFWCRNQR
jgi:hypothetical protein